MARPGFEQLPAGTYNDGTICDVVGDAIATVSIVGPASDSKKVEVMYTETTEAQNLLAPPIVTRRRKGKRNCCGCFGAIYADMKWGRMSAEGKIDYLECELMMDDPDRVDLALHRLESASYQQDFECNYRSLELHVTSALAGVLTGRFEDEMKLHAAKLLSRFNFDCGHLNAVMVTARGAGTLLHIMVTSEDPMLRAEACQILQDWATSDKFCRRLDMTVPMPDDETILFEAEEVIAALTSDMDQLVKATVGFLFKCTESPTYCKVFKSHAGVMTHVVPALLRLLDSQDGMTKYLATGSLANLTEDEHDQLFRENTVRAGALDGLIKLLRYHRIGYNGTNLCIAALAARALSHLASIESARKLMGASTNAIPWLIMLLMVNRDGDSPCCTRCRLDNCERCAAGTLAALATEPALRRKIGDSGAIPALLSLLPATDGTRCCSSVGHWDSYLPSNYKHNVLLALRNLTLTEQNKPRFTGGGGLSRIINQMFSSFSLTNDPFRVNARPCDSCRTLSVATLSKLSTDDAVCTELSTKSSLVYLVGSLRFDDDVSRRDAVVTLINLCRIDKNKERIADIGGIKALVHQCLNAKDPDLQQTAEQLIMVMGTNPQVRQQIDGAIKSFWETTNKTFGPQ